MKKYELLIIGLVGLLACYIEFINIKRDALFFSWIDFFPFVSLIALTLFFLIRNIIRKKKIVTAYIPILLGTILTSIIVFHTQYIKSLEKSELQFEARTEQIGNDGGLILYFFKNGLVKAEKMDHWCVTYYWGEYFQKKDLILIDIPLDDRLSKTAKFHGDSLLVFDNSIKFNVLK